MRTRLKRWIAIARRSLSLGFVVAAVASGTLLYGRNASQLPAHLVIDPALQSKLNLLAGGLHTEVVLCLQGTVDGDTAWASSFSMPEPHFSASDGSVSQPCPRQTLAVWHNHPWVEVRTLQNAPHTRQIRRVPLRQSVELCALSEQDIETTTRIGYSFAVVAVDSETWCWWSLDQLRYFVDRGIDVGPSVPGQVHEAD